MTALTWDLVIGAVLLLGGALALFGWSRDQVRHPFCRWYPDPTTAAARWRWWDGGTWGSAVVDGGEPADRGRRFRGEFWGWAWVTALLAALAAAAVGGWAWLSTRSVPVLVALSAVVLGLVCLAVWLFLSRQLDLAEAIPGRLLVASAVATAGMALLVARPVNTLIVHVFGLSAGLATVGPVEELTKLAVPVAVWLAGSWRDPRAGIALGLGSGFGFGIAEACLYAVAVPGGGAPDPCTGAALPAPGPGHVLADQLGRLAVTEPLHWWWTAIAITVIWRQWHRHGPRLTGSVAAAVVLVVAAHSLNDSSTIWACGSRTGGWLRFLVGMLLPLALYLVFKTVARRSLPPWRCGVVSRGWHPHHLPTDLPTGAAPATTSNAARAAAPPRSVQVAVGSVFTGVALHVINLVVHLAGPHHPVTGVVAEIAATTTGIGIAETIVVCALGAYFAVKMHQGMDWARVSLAVFAVLELLAMLATAVMVGSTGPGGPVSAVIVLLVGVTSLVFLVAAFQSSATGFVTANAIPQRAPAGR